MKKYKKPILDIVEFDNLDVIMNSGLTTTEQDPQEESPIVNGNETTEEIQGEEHQADIDHDSDADVLVTPAAEQETEDSDTDADEAAGGSDEVTEEPGTIEENDSSVGDDVDVVEPEPADIDTADEILE